MPAALGLQAHCSLPAQHLWYFRAHRSPYRPLLQQRVWRCSPHQLRAHAEIAARSRPRPGRDDASAQPTRLERFCSALMFLLPLFESMLRLYLMLFEYVRRQIQVLLAFAHVQHSTLLLEAAGKGHRAAAAMGDTLASKQDMVKVLELIYVTAHDYIRSTIAFSNPEAAQAAALQAAGRNASAASVAAAKASAPAAFGASAAGPDASSISSTFSSLEHWSGSLFSTEAKLLVMALLLMVGLASTAREQAQETYDAQRHKLSHHSAVGSDAAVAAKAPAHIFRQPQVLMLSYGCALLLRLSMGPSASVSGLMPDVFRVLSTSVTLITCSISAGIFFQLLLGPLGSFKAQAVQMAGLVRALVLGNRSLVLLDLLLALANGALGMQHKALYALSVAMYVLVLEVLGQAVEGWKKRCK